MVGGDGTILHTTNGGSDWAEQVSGTDAKLFAVDFVDRHRGTVTGWYGTILETLDGGATWHELPDRTDHDLNAVAVVGVNTGWTAGDNGTILRMPDCGAPPDYNCDLLAFGPTGIRAVQLDNDIQLTWEFTSELQSAGFEIQHQIANVRSGHTTSADLPWHPVGYVQSEERMAGAYTYLITGMDPGLHRFRIKQVDHDGGSSYSETTEVRLELEDDYLVEGPFPNPASARATIKLAVPEEQQVTLAVYDALGRLVRTAGGLDMSANQTVLFQLPTDGLAAGVYVLRIKGRTFGTDRPLVVQR